MNWQNFSKKIFSCFSLTGSKQSYGEPQDLTDIVREALKEKKPIADKSSTEPPAEEEKETRHEAKSKN